MKRVSIKNFQGDAVGGEFHTIERSKHLATAIKKLIESDSYMLVCHTNNECSVEASYRSLRQQHEMVNYFVMAAREMLKNMLNIIEREREEDN